MPIRQLPPSLVNQIAAGEVIERPGSVVKELLENAIDAGATRIDVTIEQGGMQSIRVVDDGHGIPPEELSLAVASHATSKLTAAEDLFRIATLGFRGEALASIAAVSRLTIKSRTPGRDAGAELAVDGGAVGDVIPCGCPPGTQVQVRSLFFNTPVRRKFLKSTATESGHVAESLVRVALAFPHVHFSLRHNDRLVYDLPATDDPLPRIAALLGRELADAMIPVESVDGDVRISGFVADPSHSRGNNRMQYLFLNGRHIRDRSLQHALGEAYRGLLLTGRYPIAILRLDMPPHLVDVNVHPTKLEVRFQDGSRIYSQLLATLRRKFLSCDLTTRGNAATAETPLPPAAPRSNAIGRLAVGAESSPALDQQLRIVEWAKARLAAAIQNTPGLFPDGKSRHIGARAAESGSSMETASDGSAGWDAHGHLPRRPLELVTLDEPWPELDEDRARATDDDFPSFDDADFATPTDPSLPVSREPAVEPLAAEVTSYRRDSAHLPALQIHNRYLVTESVDGVVVIDQHALHERVLYEQLRTKVLAGAVETQNLLVPEPVDLAPAEAAALAEHVETLERVGIRLAPFGGGTILVSGVPAMLRRVAPADLVRDLAAQLLSHGKTPDRRDVLDELLHMMSCKAAVKAGDPLTPAEIDALLAARHLAHDAHHCPHGRPTALVFTREDLDRQFMRT